MSKVYLIAALLVLLFSQACQSGKEKKKFKVAFSQCVGNDAWRETMLDEMKRELSFYPDIELIYRDAEGNNQKQIEQIRELVTHDIDLLIVSPNEAEPLTPIVDSVFQSYIPVIVTDRKTSSGLYNAYVGADNIAIGLLAGQYMVHILNGKGNIGILRGLKGSSASIERENGLRNSLENTPNIRVSTTLDGDWEKQTAYLRAKNNMEQLRDMDIIFAFNDQMALGTKQALEEMDVRDKKIIGVDALPGRGNGLEEITNDRLFASLLYPTGGTEAIRTAVAILEKRPYKRENILGTLIINKENAGLMVLQSNKIQQQQEDIDKRQQLITEQNKIYRNQKTVLNIVVISLVLAVVLGGISIIVIKSNREKNRHLEKQNAEITAQQQQIVDMSQQIQEVSEAKTHFFTTVSHEFKTPLTLILAPAEELEKEMNLSREGTEQIARIKRNAQKLQLLVTDLIDIHRMDKTKISLQASPVHINIFIHQVMANFKSLAQKKRISLSYINKSAIKEVWLDEYLMEQAISNLLSNAFKYTKAGGKIEVVVEENNFGDYYYLRVLDDGTGIAQTDIDHVFDPFYQGLQHQGGSGIGLAHVKEIVQIHHGQITVSSKQDIGTSFTLRLPTGDAHLQDEERKQADNNIARQLKPDIDRDLHFDEEHETETVSFYSDKASDILLVDDSAEIRMFLKDLLSKEYNLTFARTYTEALSDLEKNLPDLIITDIMLPDGSGLELLKRVKGNVRYGQVPVLLLSALDNDETRLEATKLMVDGYLAKPFKVDHLKAMITNLIFSRRKLKEQFSSFIDPIASDLGDSRHTEQEKRFLQHVQLIIEARLSDPRLSVEDIATALHISRVQLYRKTKALLNCSVNEYILQRRLKKSKHLIIEGFSIAEIAEKVGFSSAAYFAAAFKKQFGVTPTAFKKEALKR